MEHSCYAIKTVQFSSAVAHSLSINFTSEESKNLVLAKLDLLEVYSIESNHLRPILSEKLNCRILFILPLKIENQLDKIVVFEDTKFSVLGYSPSQKTVITELIAYHKHDDISPNKLEEPLIIQSKDTNSILFSDCQGIFKNLKFNKEENKLSVIIEEIRIDEGNLIDVGYIKSNNNNITTCMLTKDPHNSKLKLKEINIEQNSVFNNIDVEIDPFSYKTICLNNYILVMGTKEIGLYNLNYIKIAHADVLKFGKFIKWVIVDDDSILAIDNSGKISLIVITNNESKKPRLNTSNSESIEPKIFFHCLGNTSIPSCITKIQNMLFVGSKYGDSQLIKLYLKEKRTEAVYNIMNLAPLIDFVQDDIENRTEMLMCSNAYHHSTIKRISSVCELKNKLIIKSTSITDFFCVEKSHSLLVIAAVFNGKTIVFALENITDNYTLNNINQFDHESILMFKLNNSTFISISNTHVNYISSNFELIESCCLQLSDGIENASYYEGVVLLKSESMVSVFDINIKEVVAKIECDSIINVCMFMDKNRIAVLLGSSCKIYKLNQNNEFETVFTLQLEKSPRSIVYFDEPQYIFVGYDDGTLEFFAFDTSTNTLDLKKNFVIGTLPINLNKISLNNIGYVCILSDTCFLLEISDEPKESNFTKLEALNIKKIYDINNNCLLILKDNSLYVTSLNNIHNNKLMYETKNMDVQCKRLAHIKNEKDIGIIAHDVYFESYELINSYLILLDNNSLKYMFRIKLDNEYLAQCISTFNINSINLYGYCIGLINKDEKENNKGKIMMYSKINNSVIKILDFQTEANVYQLKCIDDLLYCCANNEIRLYRIEKNLQLTLLTSYKTTIVALHLNITQNNTIVIGDLMHSIIHLKLSNLKFEKINHYFESLYITSLTSSLDNIIVSDNNSNIIVFDSKHQNKGIVDRSHILGTFNIGDQINKMIVNKKTITMITLNGAIKTMYPLDRKEFSLLSLLQSNMQRIIPGIGNFSHTDHISFKCQKQKKEAFGIIDVDYIKKFMDLGAPLKSKIIQNMEIENDIDIISALENL